MFRSVVTGTKYEDSKWLYEWSSLWLPFLWSKGLNQHVCKAVVHTSAGVVFVFLAAKVWGIVSYGWKKGWTLLGILRSSMPAEVPPNIGITVRTFENRWCNARARLTQQLSHKITTWGFWKRTTLSLFVIFWTPLTRLRALVFGLSFKCGV